MRRYAEAIDTYAAGMEKGESSELVLGLYKARRAVGDDDEALLLLEEWTAANPDDLESQRTLALGYVASGRLDAARARHEDLLEAKPDDPVLLANLARIYQLQKETLARETAEKAVAAAPDWAVSLDTLGWILVTEGEAERGLAYLREAISRNSSALIRYHLASALSELGRLEEARNELRVILDQETQLEWIQDVRDLYEKLSSS
jgi:tetratricopeptide (TPR) repeat protein